MPSFDRLKWQRLVKVFIISLSCSFNFQIVVLHNAPKGEKLAKTPC